MPIEVEGPDGVVIEFPDNTDRATINRVMAMQYGPPTQQRQPAQAAPQQPTAPQQNALERFALGVQKPIDNLALAASRIPVVGPAIDRASEALGMPTAEQAYEANQQARSSQPQGLAGVAGNIAGTLPTLALPGGAAVQGGAAGAMLSNAETPARLAVDVGIGAFGAVAGDKLIRGAQAAIAPRVSPMVQRLRQAGVSLTPGQTARATGTRAGAALGALEDKAMSLPVVGDMIKADRVAGLNRFSIAAANRALAPIGAKVPAGMKPQEAVGYVQRATTAAYERAASKMTAQLDDDFARAIRAAREAGLDGTLAEKEAKQLEQILSSRLGRYIDPKTGRIGGKQFVAAFRSFRDLAARYSKSPDASQQELGAVLSRVFDALQDSAERNSGKAAVDAFRRARDAYANRIVIERAAASAASASGREAGAFTPNQMLSAIRQSDRTLRRGATARGAGRMQDFATDASQALPSTVPNSGTADRIWQSNILGLGIGSAAALPYATARTLNPLVTRQAGQTAQRVSNALIPLRPGARLAGPALLLRPDE